MNKRQVMKWTFLVLMACLLSLLCTIALLPIINSGAQELEGQELYIPMVYQKSNGTSNVAGQFLWDGDPAPAGSFQVYTCDVLTSEGYVTVCGLDLQGPRSVIDAEGYFDIPKVRTGPKGLVIVFNPFCAIMPHDDQGEYQEITWFQVNDTELGTFPYDVPYVWAQPTCAVGSTSANVPDYIELELNPAPTQGE